VGRRAGAGSVAARAVAAAVAATFLLVAATPVGAAPDPAPAPPPAAAPRVELEVAVGPRPVGDGRLSDRTFEPIVATHPTDPRRIAVSYMRQGPSGACGIDPGLRFSADGGRTFHEAPRRPWAGSGRGPNIHVAIAWGPGPGGRARLYWVDMTAPGCDYGRLSLSVAYTDDEGATWSRLYTERRTRPWIGGFPDVTVDRDPASPNVGVVYIGYNWPRSDETGPGFALLASADFGKTWRLAEIPVAERPAGVGATWRIAYRLRAAPDGSVYASFYQADLRRWNHADIFWKGGVGNVVRIGFSVARIRFDRATERFSRPTVRFVLRLPRNAYTVDSAPAPGTRTNLHVDPAWSTGLDVDGATGRVYLAVGYYIAAPGSGEARGSIRVGWSDDGGIRWRWTTVPALPHVGGRPQSSVKPNLVALDGIVVVTMHGIVDLPRGSAASDAVTVGTAYAVSRDGGRTWEGPFPVTAARWSATSIEQGTNGAGLRERAEPTADGGVFLAWGDGRRTGASRSASVGASSVYGTLIRPGAPIDADPAAGSIGEPRPGLGSVSYPGIPDASSSEMVPPVTACTISSETRTPVPWS
jgi:hypothetical protein